MTAPALLLFSTILTAAPAGAADVAYVEPAPRCRQPAGELEVLMPGFGATDVPINASIWIRDLASTEALDLLDSRTGEIVAMRVIRNDIQGGSLIELRPDLLLAADRGYEIRWRESNGQPRSQPFRTVGREDLVAPETPRVLGTHAPGVSGVGTCIDSGIEIQLDAAPTDGILFIAEDANGKLVGFSEDPVISVRGAAGSPIRVKVSAIDVAGNRSRATAEINVTAATQPPPITNMPRGEPSSPFPFGGCRCVTSEESEAGALLAIMFVGLALIRARRRV